MRKAHPAYAPRRGIVARWRATYGPLLLAAPWLVIALGVAAPFFNHVAWLVGLLGLAAIAAGCVLGGVDRASGAEEYVMSLPPSRREQYWIRASLGLVIPLSAILGVTIIRLDIAAKLWGLVCSSGWDRPIGYASGPMWSAAAIIVPTALFAASYGGATIGGLQVGLLATVLLGFLAGGAAMLENIRWGPDPNGWLVLPLFGLVALLSIPACYPLYLRRDMVSQGRRGHAMAIIVLIVVILIVGLLLISGVSMRKAQVQVHEAMRHETMAADVAAPAATTIDMTSSESDQGEAE